jgi:uncharacterized protein (DUF302 family)
MAPPTLSDLIRRLERELGTPLFTRTTRRVTLTAAGAELLADTGRGPLCHHCGHRRTTTGVAHSARPSQPRRQLAGHQPGQDQGQLQQRQSRPPARRRHSPSGPATAGRPSRIDPPSPSPERKPLITSVAPTIEAGIITKDSPRPPDDTVARLTRLIDARGMKIFAVIDQAGEARNVGLQLRPTTLVVFGSPAAGSVVMDAAPLAALDLPLKVLVWADGEQTKISYLSPAALAARYHLGQDLAHNLAGIDPLTDAVVAD